MDVRAVAARARSNWLLFVALGTLGGIGAAALTIPRHDRAEETVQLVVHPAGSLASGDVPAALGGLKPDGPVMKTLIAIMRSDAFQSRAIGAERAVSISVSQPPGPSIIDVTVTARNRTSAHAVAVAVVDVASEDLRQTFDAYELDASEVTRGRPRPDEVQIVLTGALLGLLLAAAFVVAATPRSARAATVHEEPVGAKIPPDVARDDAGDDDAEDEDIDVQAGSARSPGVGRALTVALGAAAPRAPVLASGVPVWMWVTGLLGPIVVGIAVVTAPIALVVATLSVVLLAVALFVLGAVSTVLRARTDDEVETRLAGVGPAQIDALDESAPRAAAASGVPVWMWVAAVLGPIIVGAAAVTAPIALLAVAAIPLAVAFAVLCTREPRMGLIVVLFLVVGYVPDILGARLGASVSTQGLIGVLAVVVFARPWARARLATMKPELAAFTALVATMTFAALFASARGVAISRVGEQVKGIVLVMLVLVLVDRAVWLRRAMAAFALAAVGLAVVTVIQQLTHTFRSDFGGFAIASSYRSSFRSEGPLSANFFGQMLVIAIVFVLYLSVTAPNRARRRVGSERRVRIAGIVGAALCVLAVTFTFSRGSLIALVAAAVTVGILRRWRALGLLAIAVVVLGTFFLPQQLKERFVALSEPTSQDAADLSTRHRLGENLAALEMFAYHPLIGVGPGNFEVHYQEYSQYIGLDPRTEPRQPHDLYLESLSEGGIIGSIPFAWILGMAAVGSWRARRRGSRLERTLGEAAFVALVALLVSGVFLHVAYPRYLWITVSFALAARRLAAERPQPTAAMPALDAAAPQVR